MNTNKLIIFPRDRELYNNLFSEAQSEILISRQALPNIDFCNLLIQLKNRDVDVQLLLTDPRYFENHSVEEIVYQHKINYDMALYSKVTIGEKIVYIEHLIKNGIYPKYIDHTKIFLNHSKYVIFDRKKLFLGSAPNDHISRLDVGIVSTNVGNIKIFKALYDADVQHKELNVEIDKHIAIAPYNSRQIITELLTQARESIYLMFPVITDDMEILKILKSKIEQNIQVYILCSPDIFIASEGESIDQKYNNELIAYGAKLKVNYNPIIHNRSIIIDPERKNGIKSKAYVGSGNLKTSSFDKSRETGILLEDHEIVTELYGTFQDIWNKI